MLFIALLKLNFIKKFQYRSYIFLSFLGECIRVLARISLWMALFHVNPAARGTTFSDMINYMALTEFLSLLKMSDIGDRLGERIKNGSISTDLIKPFNLKSFLLAQSLGGNLADFIIFVFPVYIPVLFIFGLQFPNKPLNILLFFFSLLNGAIISFYYYYLMGMFSFWLQSTWYLRFVNHAMFTLFAGSFVPLWFYPDLLVKISYFLPFRYITYEAVTFYLGRTGLLSMMSALCLQLLWIGILALLETFLWRKAQKKIMIFGG